ncbi:MAG: hypothetical protein PVH17_07455 [Anaerolineae bacterium]
MVGIAVSEVNFRLGCVLVFDDPSALAQAAEFSVRSTHPNIVADADGMLKRMQENYDKLGYHLGIPGRILEKGPEELAEFLTQARTGELWAQEGRQ